MNRVGRYLAVFLLLESLLSLLIYARYQELSGQRLDISQAELTAGYGSTLDGTRRITQLAYEELVDTDRLAESLVDGGSESAERRSLARGLLYRELHPVYRELQSLYVRQIQVTLDDGRSFLRMHRPEQYGDPVFDVRPILAEVQRSGRPMSGFETGRLQQGFRYVYPVEREGRVLGTIEFSLSFTAIREEMERVAVLEGTHYQFIVRRDRVEPKLFPAFETLYAPARLSADYLVEDPRSTLRNEPTTHTLPGIIKRLDRRLAEEGAVQSGMAERRAFGLFASEAGRTFAVNFLPVTDSEGEQVGYLVAYTPDDTHQEMFLLTMVFWLGGSVMILLVLLIHDRLRRSRHEMRTVAEHLGAGLYVLDRQGNVRYANRAAGKILGYTPAELEGRNAHELFHDGEADASDDLVCALHDRPLRGELYSSSEGCFRHRDGHLIPVEVVSTPMEVDGRITATVTVFRDITERKRTEERLTQVTTAFGNSEEGMIVTDPQENILEVNEAFTRITGYKRDQAIGRTPRLLKSGRHDRAFYVDMWRAVETHGIWRGEIWNRRRNGQIYPQFLTLSAIRDDAGHVTNYVGVFSDLSEIRETRDELERLAHQDPLTGLANRMVIEDRLEHAIERAKRRGGNVAVLFVGLDRFKTINETMGHPAGDRLLMQVASRLEDCLEKDDTLARISGDGFGILLEGADAGSAEKIAGRVIQSLIQPYQLSGREVIVGASIGMALYPEHAPNGIILLRNAETAMYRAKELGGERWVRYTDDLTSRAYDRLEMETRMRRGLERGEFSVEYHAQVDLRTGRLRGAESLIRWNNPVLGRVSPGVFIPLAEENGLVVTLGRWVLEQACRQAESWRRDGLWEGTISVNLSPNQLQAVDLLEQVDAILAETGLPASRLELEVTETALMRQPREAIETLHALKSRGVSLAIDDFGTGYSSLSYLKSLPIDLLKIDQSFIADITANGDDSAIVEAVIAMAERLGLTTLAEGVETPGQRDFLAQVGCDAYQGYLRARPLPAEGFEKLLRNEAASRSGSPADDGPDRAGANR
ncbi:MAG: EAL domain-containing protein [Pseudomonadota bacterium]